MRLSLGAVNACTGESVYFDNTTHRIFASHVMASGALPPGFAPVEIDGEYYFDGGRRRQRTRSPRPLDALVAHVGTHSDTFNRDLQLS